jgi:hypothetical protein
MRPPTVGPAGGRPLALRRPKLHAFEATDPPAAIARIASATDKLLEASRGCTLGGNSKFVEGLKSVILGVWAAPGGEHRDHLESFSRGNNLVAGMCSS